MTSAKDTLIKQCINILHREDVKTELKNLIIPVVDLILVEIYPYIYLSLIFVTICFLLNIGIFILLMRYKPVIKQL
jgi:hypothetical protein